MNSNIYKLNTAFAVRDWIIQHVHATFHALSSEHILYSALSYAFAFRYWPVFFEWSSVYGCILRGHAVCML